MPGDEGGTYCAACGLDRTDDPSIFDGARDPCPACGETALRYTRHFTATVTATASLSTSLKPGNQDRDWALRWRRLEARLPQVVRTRHEKRSADAVHDAAQDFFEFFYSAHHLKDALISDGAVPSADVEAAISSSDVLSLLADLANLDKHRKLNRPPRSGDVPAVDVADLADESSGLGWSLKLSISHKGAVIDGAAFAASVVDEWRLLLGGWGLL